MNLKLALQSHFTITTVKKKLTNVISADAK